MVDRHPAFLRGSHSFLSLVGQELHPVGTGQPHSLLAGGDRRPGGDALGIQDRRRGTAARAFCDRTRRGAAHQPPPG